MNNNYDGWFELLSQCDDKYKSNLKRFLNFFLYEGDLDKHFDDFYDEVIKFSEDGRVTNQSDSLRKHIPLLKQKEVRNDAIRIMNKYSKMPIIDNEHITNFLNEARDSSLIMAANIRYGNQQPFAGIKPFTQEGVNYFLVGANFGNGTNDVVEKFVAQGIWQLGWFDAEQDSQYLKIRKIFDQVKVGDKLVIKSSYTRLHNLPFDNRGNMSGVLMIKAVGTVTKVHDDGHTIDVDYDKEHEPREFYLFPLRQTMHILDGDNEKHKELINFINGGEQDYELFLKDIYSEEKVYSEEDKNILEDLLLEFIEYTNWCYKYNDGSHDFDKIQDNTYIKYRAKRDYLSGISVGDITIGWKTDYMYGKNKIWNKAYINHDIYKIVYDRTDEDDKILRVSKLIEKGIPDYVVKEIHIDGKVSDDQITDACDTFLRFVTKDLKEAKPIDKEYVINDIDGNYIQKIYAGAPGTGKSYIVKEEVLKGVEEENIIRTTFYPDYEYHNFIGSILPDTEGEKIRYEFIPGPFTKALKRALNQKEMVYLVIEEMTRGNCAAIFGNIFQLLDRDSSGVSEYPITNVALEKYLEVDGIVIPSNLSIVGTINTSDQNVYPMDTAFKRRFDFEYKTTDKPKEFEDFMFIDNLSWLEFYPKLNEIILEITKSEDKQLGPYFIKPGDNKTKLLMYLWNDVLLKGRKGEGLIFKQDLNTLSKVLNAKNPFVESLTKSDDED